MTRTLSSLLLVLGLGVCATGCAIGSQRTGRVIDTTRISKIKPGVSTKQDVLNMFGPPTTYSRVRGTSGISTGKNNKIGGSDDVQPRVETKAAEDVFTYEYREDNETFFTVLLFTRFRRDTIADTLMVFFDTKDVVKYVAFSKQTEAKPEAQE